MEYDDTVYNAYFVNAGEQSFYRREWYEPEEIGPLVDIVIAKSRGSARYHLWKRYKNECYLDNIHETKMTTKLLAVHIAGPARCIAYNTKDPAYILWHSRLLEC